MTTRTRTHLLRQALQHLPDLLLTSPHLSDLDLDDAFRSVLPSLIDARARQLRRETDPTVLSQAARSSVPAFHEAAAGNPRTPGPALITMLGEFYRPRPHAFVPRLLTRALALSEAPTRQTLALVAAHPNLPADALVQLSRRTDPLIAAGVARNPTTPVTILVRLSRRRDRAVRAAVRDNPRTPHPIRVRLALE